jgi:hypothetical protein
VEAVEMFFSPQESLPQSPVGTLLFIAAKVQKQQADL